MIEIWSADWTFYRKQTAKEKKKKLPVVTHTITDVVAKRLPVDHLPRHTNQMARVLRDMKDGAISDLQLNANGTFKMDVVFKKRLGIENEERMYS